MQGKNKLLATVLLCSLAANARWHSSYPHFLPEVTTLPQAPAGSAEGSAQPDAPVTFKERLKAMVPRIRKLGAMPAYTDAQRSAKEKVRDAIVEELNSDVTSLSAKQTNQLNVINRQLNNPVTVGRPDDEKTFLGEKKAEGSRSYCHKIIIYINNIINE